jgi:ABC-type transport system involved in multi-copper enzyme maturation permease subunit
MMWVAWRVQRLQYLVAMGVALVIGLWLALSGLNGNSSWAQSSSTGDIIILTSLPGLFGLALGASVVADEYRRGTNRLAWSQSISRTRWIANKLAVGTVVVCGLTGLLAPLIGWWSNALHLGLEVQPKLFGITGVAIVGYAFFSFMLGTALGAIIHRPGWAFAAGVPIFALVRILVGAVRPTLVSPVALVEPIQGSQPNGWVINYGYVPIGRTTPAAGQMWSTLSQQAGACFDRDASSASQTHCALVAHLHWVWQYQSEGHFWSLQLAETAIFVVAAFACMVATFVVVRRQEA